MELGWKRKQKSRCRRGVGWDKKDRRGRGRERKKPARLRGLFGCLTEERTTGQGTGEKKLLLVRKQSGLPIGRCGPLRPRSGTAISHSSVSDSNARLLAPARSARREAFRLAARLVKMVSPTSTNRGECQNMAEGLVLLNQHLVLLGNCGALLTPFCPINGTEESRLSAPHQSINPVLPFRPHRDCFCCGWCFMPGIPRVVLQTIQQVRHANVSVPASFDGAPPCETFQMSCLVHSRLVSLFLM